MADLGDLGVAMGYIRARFEVDLHFLAIEMGYRHFFDYFNIPIWEAPLAIAQQVLSDFALGLAFDGLGAGLAGFVTQTMLTETVYAYNDLVMGLVDAFDSPLVRRWLLEHLEIMREMDRWLG